MNAATYPSEITHLEKEIRSTHNAIWNCTRQGRPVPQKTHRDLDRLEKRLAKMKQLYWMVVLSAWIKNMGTNKRKAKP